MRVLWHLQNGRDIELGHDGPWSLLRDHSAELGLARSSRPTVINRFYSRNLTESSFCLWIKVNNGNLENWKCCISPNSRNDDKNVHYVVPLVGRHHIVHAFIVIQRIGEADFHQFGQLPRGSKSIFILIPTYNLQGKSSERKSPPTQIWNHSRTEMRRQDCTKEAARSVP